MFRLMGDTPGSAPSQLIAPVLPSAVPIQAPGPSISHPTIGYNLMVTPLPGPGVPPTMGYVPSATPLPGPSTPSVTGPLPQGPAVPPPNLEEPNIIITRAVWAARVMELQQKKYTNTAIMLPQDGFSAK